MSLIEKLEIHSLLIAIDEEFSIIPNALCTLNGSSVIVYNFQWVWNVLLSNKSHTIESYSISIVENFSFKWVEKNGRWHVWFVLSCYLQQTLAMIVILLIPLFSWTEKSMHTTVQLNKCFLLVSNHLLYWSTRHITFMHLNWIIRNFYVF